MRFSGSKAITDTFAIIRARFASLALIGLASFTLPMLMGMILLLPRIEGWFRQFGKFDKAEAPDFGAMLTQLQELAPILLAGYLGWELVRAIATSLLTAAAGASDRDPPSESVAQGLGGALSVMGLSLLILAVSLVAFGLIGLGFWSAFAPAFEGRQTPAIGSIFGLFGLFLVLLIAMMVLFARLALAVPVIVLEKQRNPLTAIGRSWKLTSGATLKIIALFVLFSLIVGVINSVIDGFAGGSWAERAMRGQEMNWIGPIAYCLQMALSGIVMAALSVAIYLQRAGPPLESYDQTFS